MSSNRSTLSSIYLQEGPPHELFFCEMQLTLHATRPTPHGASRFLMCKQISICLDGEDPNALGPDIIGTRGGSVESLVIQLPSHECHEYTHPPRPLPCRSLKKRLESANPRYSLLATVRVMLCFFFILPQLQSPLEKSPSNLCKSRSHFCATGRLQPLQNPSHFFCYRSCHSRRFFFVPSPR